MPEASVMIPAYNSAALIGDVIRSVLMQTYPNFEIIVVDDGSTDGSRDVVAAFNDQRIRYHYQENHGVAVARNTGIAHSRGQHIAFLGADDLFLPHKLMQQVPVLESQPEVGLVAGGYLFIDEASRPLAAHRRTIWSSKPG